MENKFNVGDIVQLNSGGPEMTIECYPVPNEDFPPYTYNYQLAECVWFNGNELNRNTFVIDNLKHLKKN